MASGNRWGLPDLGIGVGLRSPHYPHILEHWPEVDWFEILSENYLATGGRPLQVVEQIAARYPVAMHGVSMNLGSADPLDLDHLQALKELAERVQAAWLGDHVCWTGVAGRNSHDLLPVPYTEEVLRHLVRKVRAAQDFLERPLVLENPSTYLAFTATTMPEEEFIARLAEEADCALLVDVNNILVNARNHGSDPWKWLAAIPWDRVVQIHVAGHTDHGSHCIDTHVGPVPDPVWELYAEAERRSGGCAVLLEWDQEIPDFPTVHAEARRAEAYRSRLRQVAQP